METVAKIHRNPRVTNQGQRHAHDHGGEDEVEGGDLKHVAVRVWVPVDIFVLSGHAQRVGGTILPVSLLGFRWSQKDTKINTTTATTTVSTGQMGKKCSWWLPALKTWSWTPTMPLAESLSPFWPRTVNTATGNIINHTVKDSSLFSQTYMFLPGAFLILKIKMQI